MYVAILQKNKHFNEARGKLMGKLQVVFLMFIVRVKGCLGHFSLVSETKWQAPKIKEEKMY